MVKIRNLINETKFSKNNYFLFNYLVYKKKTSTNVGVNTILDKEVLANLIAKNKKRFTTLSK